MKSNRVRITKIGVNPDAEFETATKDNYKCGEINDKSPFLDYYVEGVLLREIGVGNPIQLLRDNRNGVSSVGMFNTSEIISIEFGDFGTTLKTINSIYKLEQI